MKYRTVALGPFTELSIQPREVVGLVVNKIAAQPIFKLSIGEGAGVHLIVPAIPINSVYTIEVDSLAQCTISILGKLKHQHQSNLSVNLKGQQAKVNLELACVGEVDSAATFNLTLDHLAPRTVGRITSRRVQRGKSSGSLLGKLLIGQSAKGTDTYLSDKVLLLGSEAQAKSEPQLEILADDVKASHGATIGQLSQAELFYLRSRGLPQVEAEVMLLTAFLKPALVGVPLDLTHQLLHGLSTWQSA